MKALAASREKRSLALLAPWHQAEARGRQSERSQAIPAQGPPDKAHAMRQAALFQRAGLVPPPTGQRAPKQLLEAGQPQRLGQGGVQEPYRYCQGFKSFRRDLPERWSDKCIHSAPGPGQTGCLRPVRTGFKLMKGKRLSGAGIPVALPRLLSPHCFSLTQRDTSANTN